MKTPVYFMEEHNEAFYCWNYMIAAGEILPAGNLLFHISSHPDFFGEDYKFNLDFLPVSLAESKKLAYEKMGTGEYIRPAVYQRIFTQVIFMLSGLKKEIMEHNLKALCYDGGILYEKDMDANTVEYVARNEQEGNLLNIRPYSYFVGGETYYNILQEMPCVLDIDLNYFCCDDFLSTVNEPRWVEISEEQYRKIKDNPYHFLRIEPVLAYSVLEKDGHFYLEMPGPNKDRQIPIPDKKEVLRRLDSFFAYLKTYFIRPAAIDVSRSRLSGFLPRTYFPWIEEEFLSRLEKQYDLEIKCRPSYEYPEI